MTDFIFAFTAFDSQAIVAYFQEAVEWGLEASAKYLSYLGAIFLVVRLFSSK